MVAVAGCWVITTVANMTNEETRANTPHFHTDSTCHQDTTETVSPSRWFNVSARERFNDLGL